MPDGYFYIKGAAPDGFDLDHIRLLVGVNWDRPVRDSQLWAGGRAYKFTKLSRFRTHSSGGGITFDFETESVDGISYTFSGTFHSICVLAEDEREPEKMVAEGRLTKLRAGNEMATAEVRFTYSKSQRRHAHWLGSQCLSSRSVSAF